MRLIVCYTHGDGYTYSCDRAVPFEYESAEKLLVDIESLVTADIDYRKTKKEVWDAFNVAWNSQYPRKEKDVAKWNAHRQEIMDKFPNKEVSLTSGDSILYLDHFTENSKFFAPEIYTVDEWFAQAGL